MAWDSAPTTTSFVFLAAILATVVYLCISKADRIESESAVELAMVNRRPYPAAVALRVVVVEDDRVHRQSPMRGGPGHGQATRSTGVVDGAAATAAVERSDQLDLVLLDAGLPGHGRVHVCVDGCGRTYPDLPIILVTARDAEIDIVVGLDAGASDYVTKPFSMSVLLARVRAHLRGAEHPECGVDRARPAAGSTPAPTRLGSTAHRVDLRRREFELLVHLARHAGRVVTSGTAAGRGLGRPLGHVVEVARHAHRGAAPEARGEAVDIATVRGVGYRLSPS